MAKIKEIKAFLESLVPPQSQDSWDNSGVQICFNEEREVKRLGFALSVSGEVLELSAQLGVELLITHHPITIGGVKRISAEGYPEALFLKALERGISIYSMHTNLDVSPYGPTVVIAKILGLTQEEPLSEGTPSYGIVGRLKNKTKERVLLLKLLSSLPRDVVRTVGHSPEREVERVAICSGSGASLIDEAAQKAELYITGDVKYHDALKALELGLTVFDVGHFGSERLFYKEIGKLLSESFPELELIAIPEKSPFEVAGDG